QGTGPLCGDFQSDRVASYGCGLNPRILVLEIKRNLAGDSKALDAQAADLSRCRGAIEIQCNPLNEIRRKNVENAVLFQNGEHARRGVQAERLPLPKRQEPGNMIHIAIRQNDGLNWRIPHGSATPWL